MSSDDEEDNIDSLSSSIDDDDDDDDGDEEGEKETAAKIGFSFSRLACGPFTYGAVGDFLRIVIDRMREKSGEERGEVVLDVWDEEISAAFDALEISGEYRDEIVGWFDAVADEAVTWYKSDAVRINKIRAASRLDQELKVGQGRTIVTKLMGVFSDYRKALAAHERKVETARTDPKAKPYDEKKNRPIYPNADHQTLRKCVIKPLVDSDERGVFAIETLAALSLAAHNVNAWDIDDATLSKKLREEMWPPAYLNLPPRKVPEPTIEEKAQRVVDLARNSPEYSRGRVYDATHPTQELLDSYYQGNEGHVAAAMRVEAPRRDFYAKSSALGPYVDVVDFLLYVQPVNTSPNRLSVDVKAYPQYLIQGAMDHIQKLEQASNFKFDDIFMFLAIRDELVPLPTGRENAFLLFIEILLNMWITLRNSVTTCSNIFNYDLRHFGQANSNSNTIVTLATIPKDKLTNSLLTGILHPIINTHLNIGNNEVPVFDQFDCRFFDITSQLPLDFETKRRFIDAILSIEQKMINSKEPLTRLNAMKETNKNFKKVITETFSSTQRPQYNPADIIWKLDIFFGWIIKNVPAITQIIFGQIEFPEITVDDATAIFERFGIKIEVGERLDSPNAPVIQALYPTLENVIVLRKEWAANPKNKFGNLPQSVADRFSTNINSEIVENENEIDFIEAARIYAASVITAPVTIVASPLVLLVPSGEVSRIEDPTLDLSHHIGFFEGADRSQVRTLSNHLISVNSDVFLPRIGVETPKEKIFFIKGLISFE